MKVVFIVPCFNASPNIETLATSLLNQTNKNWHCIFINDMSEDDTSKKLKELSLLDQFTFVENKNKKYALRNIVTTARLFQERSDIIVAVIDGDDSLCNDETVDILIKEYQGQESVVWTGHRWDINDLNISKNMPENVNPYMWPWCASHLRTFSSSLLKDISDTNFKDLNSEWFKRGYDQALMLPILSLTNRRKYVNEICYLYNINSCSMPARSWEENDQISTINIVRARGFLKS
jgi:glycosyltransferase involved in cell wall biosynthesis